MTERDALDPNDEIASAVAAITARRGWRLLSPVELEDQVRQALASGHSATPEKAVLYCYSRALYAACAGHEGRERQELGYRELFRYAYDISRFYAPDCTPDEREEVANLTIAEIFYRLTAPAEGGGRKPVREPGAFLAVLTQQIRNVLRGWWRGSPRWDDPLSDDLAVPDGALPEQIAATGELRDRVRICFERSLVRHPRARLQLDVVWLRHMGGAPYELIAERYKMTLPNVRVLYSRGLDKLRSDPDWTNLGRDFGML